MKTGLTNCPERIEAQRLGHRFYQPPKPCRNGHDSKRYTNSGACVECSCIKYSPRMPHQSELDSSIQTVVYVITAGEYVKVGIAEDVGARLQVTQTHCPIEARLVYSTSPLPRALARAIEGWCAVSLADFATRGEWYRCDPAQAIAVIEDSYQQAADRAVDQTEATQLRLVA